MLNINIIQSECWSPDISGVYDPITVKLTGSVATPLTRPSGRVKALVMYITYISVSKSTLLAVNGPTSSCRVHHYFAYIGFN